MVRRDERTPVAVPGDSGLRCPQCGYNLTGLTVNRCPECSREFDPEELRQLLTRPPPIPGWDDRGDSNILVAFLRVCLLTWCHPVQFARQFPWNYNRRSVARFGWLTRVAAVGLYLAITATLYMASGVFQEHLRIGAGNVLSFVKVVLIPIVLATLLGSLSCEAALSAMLGSIVPAKTGSSWWGFVRFHSSFLILSGAISGLLFNMWLFETRPFELGRPLEWVPWPAAAINLAWWWCCLGTGVVIRSSPGAGQLVVILLIPIVGIGAIVMGVCLGLCCGFLLFCLE